MSRTSTQHKIWMEKIDRKKITENEHKRGLRYKVFEVFMHMENSKLISRVFFVPAPVFEIYSRRIKPGQTEAFERLREGFFRWVSRFDGVLGSAEFRYYLKKLS